VEVQIYPAPCLLKEAEAIEEVTGEIRDLASGMLETMYESRGVGLAAPQVGVSRRLIVINTAAEPGAGREIVLINPEIVEQSDEIVEAEEGCLSVPGVTGNVPRRSSVRVVGLDPEGRKVEIEGEGLLARALQHEIDHLDGILFFTKLGPVDRSAVKQKIRDLKAKAR
jgi:peptide deformylase